MPRTKFGRMLLEGRTSIRVTFRELGRLIDLPPSVLSEMENGRRLPPSDTGKVEKLANFLGLDKISFLQAATEARRSHQGGSEKRLHKVDPDLAGSFARLVNEWDDDELKEKIQEFVNKYSR